MIEKGGGRAHTRVTTRWCRGTRGALPSGQGEARAVWATTGRASTARMATTATTLNMRVDSPKDCLCPADSHTVEVKVLRLVRGLRQG